MDDFEEEWMNEYYIEMDDAWEDIIDFMFAMEDKLNAIVDLHNMKVVTPSQIKKITGK